MLIKTMSPHFLTSGNGKKQNSDKIPHLSYHGLNLARMFKSAAHGDLGEQEIAPGSQQRLSLNSKRLQGT
jgi:hypothetical protein